MSLPTLHAATAVLLAAAVAPCSAQDPEARIPPRSVEPPAAFRRALLAGTRSPDGGPGEGYWQQRVDYEIDAELDPAAGTLLGSETITYHNRSPDTLAIVLLRLEQNVFAEGARRNRRVEPTGGITVEGVRVDGAPATLEHPGSGYYEALTLGEVALPRPLAPGGTASIELERFTSCTPGRRCRVGDEEQGLRRGLRTPG